MINIFFGPKNKFELTLPKKKRKTTLIELAIKSDAMNRKHIVHIEGHEPMNDDLEIRETIECLVGYSDDYAGLSENAIQSFISFLSRFDVKDMYLQNPPVYIVEQLEKLRKKIKVNNYTYNTLNLTRLVEFYNDYDERILGQDVVKTQLAAALYSVARGHSLKPLVVLFYGPTGVGKTETGKYLGEILGENLFRKQFSMFHSEDFASYLFGGRHSQNCLARELLERESNIILFDEFDKPNPVFFSAFYQLFDEGVFEDKNYRVTVGNSIIICTSNFKNEDEIRDRLGDPIYSRFDAIIRFNDLPIEAIRRIIDDEYKKQIANLDDKEYQIIAEKSIHDMLQDNADALKNARHIRKVVREMISILLIQSLLNGDSQNTPSEMN